MKILGKYWFCSDEKEVYSGEFCGVTLMFTNKEPVMLFSMEAEEK